jgi:hypothetical protein
LGELSNKSFTDFREGGREDLFLEGLQGLYLHI